jgi:hypothetical protein
MPAEAPVKQPPMVWKMCGELRQHMTEAPRMISVLRDDHSCLGFLRTNPRGFQSYDSDGRLIGAFQDKAEAVAAIVSSGDST